MYSCLANGSAEEFQKGERLFRNDSVSDILQIGMFRQKIKMISNTSFVLDTKAMIKKQEFFLQCVESLI